MPQENTEKATSLQISVMEESTFILKAYDTEMGLTFLLKKSLHFFSHLIQILYFFL